MSDPPFILKVDKKKGKQMIAKLTNGTLIPLHWDDRYYVANCPECGDEVSASTASDVAEILDIHC
jgi:hypothetical protein